MALGARRMATVAECTPNGLTSYEAASTTPRRGSPPTITLSAIISRSNSAKLMKTFQAVVGCNVLIMLSARPIGTLLQRQNVTGALIRIAGMIVATIAVQMCMHDHENELSEGCKQAREEMKKHEHKGG